MRKIALNILVLAATLLLTLAAVEVALRWLMPVDYRPPASELPNVARDIIYQKSSVPGLDYELVPNMDTTAHGARVKINSAGMRDDEPDPALPKIVVLGDSFSFGFQLEQDESFPARLDAALDTADVLNLAVAGYAMKDYVAVLKNKGLAWQPEVIIVGYVLNDPETEAIQQIPAYFRQADWWQYSHVLRLFAQGYKRVNMLIKGGGNYYRYLHADPTSWQSVVSGFEQIRQMAAENNSRVIVVLFPDLWHNWDSYPYAAIHRQVADQAAANGFEVIDLRDAFSAYPPAELRVSGSDAHPNALANQIAAAEILKRLNP